MLLGVTRAVASAAVEEVDDDPVRIQRLLSSEELNDIAFSHCCDRV